SALRLSSRIRRAPVPTLFPYTTLFRSPVPDDAQLRRTALVVAAFGDEDVTVGQERNRPGVLQAIGHCHQAEAVTTRFVNLVRIRRLCTGTGHTQSEDERGNSRAPLADGWEGSSRTRDGKICAHDVVGLPHEDGTGPRKRAMCR